MKDVSCMLCGCVGVTSSACSTLSALSCDCFLFSDWLDGRNHRRRRGGLVQRENEWERGCVPQ